MKRAMKVMVAMTITNIPLGRLIAMMTTGELIASSIPPEVGRSSVGVVSTEIVR